MSLPPNFPKGGHWDKECRWKVNLFFFFLMCPVFCLFLLFPKVIGIDNIHYLVNDKKVIEHFWFEAGE